MVHCDTVHCVCTSNAPDRAWSIQKGEHAACLRFSGVFAGKTFGTSFWPESSGGTTLEVPLTHVGFWGGPPACSSNSPALHQLLISAVHETPGTGDGGQVRSTAALAEWHFPPQPAPSEPSNTAVRDMFRLFPKAVAHFILKTSKSLPSWGGGGGRPPGNIDDKSEKGKNRCQK